MCGIAGRRVFCGAAILATALVRARQPAALRLRAWVRGKPYASARESIETEFSASRAGLLAPQSGSRSGSIRQMRTTMNTCHRRS